MMRQFLTGLPITVRYLIAGGTSTAIDLGILYVLTEFAGWWYLVSATAAFIVAFFVSFILQKFYTFNNRDTSRKTVATQGAFYFTLALTNLGINTILMYALVEWAGVWYFLAQIISAAAIAVESFFIYRFVIFHPKAVLAERMTRLVSVLLRHRAAFVVAVAVSLLYGMHHFLMPRFMPEGLEYKPVTYESDPDAGGYYGPRANAFFSRNEITTPSFLPIANPLIMGGLGKMLGNMEHAYIVSDFMFPPLIFLTVYALARELLRRKTASLVLSSVFIVSPYAVLYVPPISGYAFKEFVAQWFPFFSDPSLLYFSSFEYPKITFLFYVGALFFIFRALARGGRKNVLLAGLFFGSLFYTYLYDWAYIVVSLFIMLAWFAVRREWVPVKSCAGIFGIGALLSIPYWLNFTAVRRLPQYGDIMFRIGGIEVGRHFRFSSVWKTYARHIVWIAALAATSLKRAPRSVIFLTSLLAAYFVVVNVQVVLGFSPQPDHWYRETFLPITLAFGVLLVWLWDRYIATHIPIKKVRALFFVFIVLFFAQAFYGQYLLSRGDVGRWGIEKRYANAYDWLNANTDAGTTVWSISRETSRDIILFSSNTVFLRSGGTTLASNEELWERLFVLAARWELSPEQLSVFAHENTPFIFHDYYRSREMDNYFKTAPTRSIPNEELTRRVNAYAVLRSRLASPSFSLQYLFVGPREEKIAPTPHAFKTMPLVYEAEGVQIYRFNYGNKE